MRFPTRLALLLTLLLCCPLVQAVSINPNGLGQVLIYPYYTVRGGNDTLISVVNSTAQPKAIKIRFREGWNSRSVFSLNIYLAPRDSWVAAVTLKDGAATLLTPDNSCTVPYLYSVFANHSNMGELAFSTLGYSGDNEDGGPTDPDRAAEGFIEVIEMGEIDADSDTAAAIRHGHDDEASGLPADCLRLINAWTARHIIQGYWIRDADADLTPPAGGLSGQVAIVNPDRGTMYTYAATALLNFHQADGVEKDPLHTFPGSPFPDLNSGNVFTAELKLESPRPSIALPREIQSFEFQRSVDAVSAVFMKSQLFNEFNVDPAIGAASEWVFTFPTRQFYMDPKVVAESDLGLTPPLAPFGIARDHNREVNEVMELSLISDREGKFADEDPHNIRPCVTPCTQYLLPQYPINRTNQSFRFGTGLQTGQTPSILGSESNIEELPIPDRPFSIPLEGLNDIEFHSGTVGVEFSQQHMAAMRGQDQYRIIGLPVLGFWVQSFSNNTLQNNTVLANYGGIFAHHGRTEVMLLEETQQQ